MSNKKLFSLSPNLFVKFTVQCTEQFCESINVHLEMLVGGLPAVGPGPGEPGGRVGAPGDAPEQRLEREGARRIFMIYLLSIPLLSCIVYCVRMGTEFDQFKISYFKRLGVVEFCFLIF